MGGPERYLRTLLAHPAGRPDELMPGRSVRRPSVVCLPQFTKNASLSIHDRFQLCLICVVELASVHCTSSHNFEIVIINEATG